MGEELDRATSDIIGLIWFAGFHPIYTVVASLIGGAFLGQMLGSIQVGMEIGLLSGPLVWVAGTRHVNNNYEKILAAFQAEAKARAREMLRIQGNVNTYTIRYSTGSTMWVTPGHKYGLTTLVIGDSSVAIYSDATMQFDRLDAEFGKSTREFYFDQITSVNYDAPHIEIKSTDGDLMRYVSSTKPDDVLKDLQDRLREYKRQGV